MKFTANSDIPDYARHVLEAVQALETKTRAALAEIDENEELKDEVKQAKKELILDGYKTAFSEIRKTYGGKVDNRLEELRKLGELIPEPQPNPAVSGIIAMLSGEGALVSERMIELAAQQIGDDALGREALARIANRHGFGSSLAMGKPPKPRLSAQMLDSIADDFLVAFKRYFDSREAFADYVHPSTSDEWENNAMRNDSTAALKEIANGNSFRFGGNTDLQMQFDNLAASAEL